MVKYYVEPTTRDEKIYLILKTIEKYVGIGPNQLQEKTQIPKKTLYKYLEELETDQVIIKKKTGKKSNSRVSYTVNFPDELKKVIKEGLDDVHKFRGYYSTKIQKSNTFPHHLQELAAECYLNLVSYFFYSVPQYKFGMKSLEELLELEKKRLEKEFKGKSKFRLWEACQEVYFELIKNASDSMQDAASRNSHRSRDEIHIDCINTSKLGMSTQHKQDKELRVVAKKYGIILENSRVDYIKDRKVKKKFIELADEYDRLADRLSTIKHRLAGITGAIFFEPTDEAIRRVGGGIMSENQ